MNKAHYWRTVCGAFLLCFATAIGSPAQTFTTVFNFDVTDGDYPGYGSLVQGTDGNFYGTTIYGGTSSNCTYDTYGCGTVFKITPSGTLTTLHTFCADAKCTDGYYPFAGLILGSDGDFYGTTQSGGAHLYCGTAFKINSAGKLTTLHSFGSRETDGCGPAGALVQARNGNFYGTTESGGTNGGGTIFELTPAGKLTSLYQFCNVCGVVPYSPTTGLVQANNGNFYGVTENTVFEVTPRGILTVLHDFEDSGDGIGPVGELILGRNGNLYGTTAGFVGTVFEITPAGELTTLHVFCAQTDCPDGASPMGSLIQATDGNFYGTTSAGGAHPHCSGSLPKGCGTIFKITPSGTLTTLHSFHFTDGLGPLAGLTQSTDGNLYGTAPYDSAAGGTAGTVFKLSTGLKPFVQTLPAFGNAGVNVTLLGTKLTGATSVKFNGTIAAFTVVSPSQITTSVPAGATTGLVQVSTPQGTIESESAFRVTP